MNENLNEEIEVEYTEEDKKQLHRRVFKMVSISGLTLIVLIVATYAWFIGTTTVNANPFVIDVETFTGLQISFTGANFASSASIDNTNYNLESTGMVNNHWVSSNGLKPVSSSGNYSTTGHLKLYENSSVAAITGGYRLRTVKVKNEPTTGEGGEQDSGFDATTTSPEKDQYIAFDLLLKNTTNTQGTQANRSSFDVREAESIYLTTNSKVELVDVNTHEVVSQEGKVNGIENSVRIGLFQIAYSPLNAAQATLQSMDCTGNDANDNIVGLCPTSDSTGPDTANRGIKWNIWEPNDQRHIGKALSNYNSLCKQRSGQSGDVYSGSCVSIADNQYANTYAVNKVINVNTVNIYDGLNKYYANIGTGEGQYLYNTGNNYDDVNDPYNPASLATANVTSSGTFKSSENVITGNENDGSIFLTNRPAILKIAPNSVTKIRVYIWLEGQDIDNLEYDANENYLLKFSFGFTKDMFELDATQATAAPSESPSASPSASEGE